MPHLPHGNNEVEVIKGERAGHLTAPFSTNLSEFPTGCLLAQLTFSVDIGDVLNDIGPRGLKQVSQLLLTQPDRIAIKPYIDSRRIIPLIQNDFSAGLLTHFLPVFVSS